MFQVGDIIAMSWPAIGLTEKDSWSYGVVSSIDADNEGLTIGWFHDKVDYWYRMGYALKHFKRIENGKG